MKQLLILIGLFLVSCSSYNKADAQNKTEDMSTGDGKYIITAPIVYKPFIMKNGVAGKRIDIYIQRSIQDYYVKFCESHITKKELEDYLSTIDSDIKTVTLEVEFRDGEWDICDGNYNQQSRIGEYVIIHKIVEGN